MAEVTGYTAEKMQDLADENVIDGHISGDNLILEQRGGGTIDAGSVRGPQGVPGTDSSIVICTSSTRPTGEDAFEGLRIYETDTNKEYVYNGTDWVDPPIHLDSDSANQATFDPSDGLMVDRNAGDIVVIGHGNRISGAILPTAGDGGWKVQFGSAVVTTNVGGEANIYYPIPFPNSLATILVSLGDVLAITDDGQVGYITVVNAYTDKVSARIRVERAPNVTVDEANIRVNWIAIGA